MKIKILGISAFFHDSSAAIVIDGEIKAAAQEERFTRIKHDPSFPTHAIRYVLEEVGLSYSDLTAVVYYEKPFLKFERILETIHAMAPRGLKFFIEAIPIWIKGKLSMRDHIRRSLGEMNSDTVPLLFSEHHLSHAASAFYPSPFAEAAILTIDGVGEWTTTAIMRGERDGITVLKELRFPHSVGLLYAAFTYYLGFKVNSGEYKVMGLAPYGNQTSGAVSEFRSKILREMVEVKDDGSILLSLDFFNFVSEQRMTNDSRWQRLLGIPRREPESDILQIHMDMAAAIQQITEMIVLRLAKTAQLLTGSRNLVMAGGVALNCVSNSRIVEANIFSDVWIQPAAGDAGGAVGAALAASHIVYGVGRDTNGRAEGMSHCFLGPQFYERDIRKVINQFGAHHTKYHQFDNLTAMVSRQLADGKIVGWFQGRMEFGPRALGNRSILADPRNPEMQKKLNVNVKFREEFRPFAPSILEEDVAQYFSKGESTPYMLFVRDLRADRRYPEPDNYADLELFERLYHLRSELPAVTHIDYSARLQTVNKDSHSRYWTLINDFKKLTGIGVLINTSFNMRGEPIVCTPTDAYLAFMRTHIDILVMENFVFDKTSQPAMGGEHSIAFEKD